jgi:hypothetical protein
METGDIGQKRQASLNVTGTRLLPRVTAEAPKMAKRLAKTWKWATSGKKREATLNVTRTRTLRRVTEDKPVNSQVMDENVETGDLGRKQGCVT